MKSSTYHLIGCALWVLSLLILFPWDSSWTSAIRFVVGGSLGIYAIMFIAKGQLPDEKSEKKSETPPLPEPPST